eukprot:TRINITY_DN9404_c0_g1_i1.p1 TRINITY_DN9404_c0_g1~~TRINITY_DN9404_c0_g1_i1.p1  ORF type:complete len:187 (+),score=27.12 TRINITY_DN9404_c0_g1_i1:118-678(+)
MSKTSQRAGEVAFSKMEKINSELFTLTYGAVVSQLLKDYEDVAEVNKQLEKMGYNIGVRLIDEFLSKSNTTNCADFKDTAEAIAKVGFKMFLGVTASVGSWSSDNSEFSLFIPENPLADFIELPDHLSDLWYSNILCGVIRGALEMVQMKVECKFVRDQLRDDDGNEIRVILKEMMREELIEGYAE